MSIVGTVIFTAIFLYGLVSLVRLAYVKSVPIRHKVVNHSAERGAITLADTDRFIREQEHELWPDKELRHVNCTICGPGPLKQGVVPSQHDHPFFTKGMEDVSDGYGSWKVEVLRAARAEDAEMVSSKVIKDGRSTGQHTLMLDLDFPVTVVESSTTGHYHLYADVLMSWRQYSRVLKALADAEIIEQGYYRAAMRQRATMLRPPWVKKPTATIVPRRRPSRRQQTSQWVKRGRAT